MEQTLLSIEHLKKSYDDNLILDDINLEVHQGEVIVLVGPSGCGKSTMLRCINALEPIQGGEIKLNGEKIDPKNKNIAELRLALCTAIAETASAAYFGFTLFRILFFGVHLWA